MNLSQIQVQKNENQAFKFPDPGMYVLDVSKTIVVIGKPNLDEFVIKKLRDTCGNYDLSKLPAVSVDEFEAYIEECRQLRKDGKS